MEKYDLVVIGSGPAGEKAAVKAAYFGYRVALIEKEKCFGGAGVNTGTLPSKTLKETALYFSGNKEKGLFGVERILQHQATIKDFMFHKNVVSTSEGDEVERNLHQHKVDIYQGIASFEDSHTVKISGEEEHKIYGDYIILATGSYPFHPEEIPFDGKRIHDSDTILEITRIPQSICIVGAGVIGCEYVTIFAEMGCKVYLINRSEVILPFIDKEVTTALIKNMKTKEINIFFNESIQSINIPKSDDEHMEVNLESGKSIQVDMFLYAAGRNGSTKSLQCENAGLTIGKREQLEVDEKYCTNVPHIFAVGDVVGFPALASTSMDQGRVAVTHIFNTGDLDNLAKVIPYGIYTIPEISMVGLTEEEAIAKKMNYCVGRARFNNMARGKIMGATDGFLKLIFTRDDLVIQGVHIIGPLATELIHFGLSLIDDKKTVMHVISTVFNYPTLHDLYKYAAYDGLGNLSGHKIKD